MTKAKKSTATTKKTVRQVKQQPYRSFRLQKRIKHSSPKLASAPKIFWRTLKHLKKNWRLFGGIGFVYLGLTLLLVTGFGSSIDLSELKQVVDDIFVGNGGTFLSSLTIFGVLLSSSTTVAEGVASTYQAVLLVLFSLAIIWSLRQTHAGKKVDFRDVFYKSMYPLVPFLLVLLVVTLQLLPIALINLLQPIIFVGGLAVTGLEQVLWLLLFFFLALLSFYMLTSSVFALYIVTLPDMTPLKALRTARGLVLYRRWTIMRKVFFLPLALVVLGALIMLPVIIYALPLAEWIFFGLSMTVLAVAHGYIYSLYRDLL